ncbi:Protein SDS23 [Trichinella pseudospiralis]
MTFKFYILLVFFSTLSKAQMLGGATHWGEDDPFMTQKAKDALLSWTLKQQSGTYKKLIKFEESSTMGTTTLMVVKLQDTNCTVSAENFSSYTDIEKHCSGQGEMEDCTIEYKYRDTTTATIACTPGKKEEKEAQLEEQSDIPVSDSSDLREENLFVSQEAKDALLKWSLKQSSGVYKKLIKSEKSSTMGADTSIRVWLQDTDCPILAKKFSSYADIEAQCNGMGQSKDCRIQFKNPDMTKVSLTCIVRKDVRPTQQSDIPFGDLADLREENLFVSQEAKDALLKWSLKQSSGVYKKLIKSEKSSTIGADTSIRVWLQDTDCPILAKKFSSYADIEAQCNGMGQSKDCRIQFKNPDMAKVSLTCIVRKDVRPMLLQNSRKFDGRTLFLK